MNKFTKFFLFPLYLLVYLNSIYVNAEENIYTLQTIEDNLYKPWSVTFLPNNKMLVTESSGKIKVFINDELSGSLNGVPDVYEKSQAGLSDIIIHPNFKDNNWIYLSFSLMTENGNTLRVIRATLKNNNLTEIENILTANALRTSSIHYGARLLFLKDNTLLISSGEAGNQMERAQDLDTHLGKILRINDDGSIPSDNPFINTEGALPEIWSYGHRNPQGLTLYNDNFVISHEHGPKGGDELNYIRPGLNYGWPAITYGINYNGSIISPFKKREGMEQPLYYWVPSIAPSDITVYKGDLFPEWKNNIFISALSPKDGSKGNVRRLVLQDGEIISEDTMFQEVNARIRSVKTAPDGTLIILTDGRRSNTGIGKVIKVKRK